MGADDVLEEPPPARWRRNTTAPTTPPAPTTSWARRSRRIGGTLRPIGSRLPVEEARQGPATHERERAEAVRAAGAGERRRRAGAGLHAHPDRLGDLDRAHGRGERLERARELAGEAVDAEAGVAGEEVAAAVVDGAAAAHRGQGRGGEGHRGREPAGVAVGAADDRGDGRRARAGDPLAGRAGRGAAPLPGHGQRPWRVLTPPE